MIDALLATLEREAEGEIARITEEARARAAELAAAGERRIAERRAATLTRTEAETRAEHGRALSAARAAARVRVLDARTALLDRVFATLTTIRYIQVRSVERPSKRSRPFTMPSQASWTTSSATAREGTYICATRSIAA